MAEFKNPNQQGGQDNSSFLIMMFVVVAVLFGVQYYHSKTNPKTASPSSGQTAASQTTVSQSSASTPAATASTAASTAPATASAAPTSATPAVQAATEATTVVENELYRIEFSNRGAEVRSWVLKRYTDSVGKPLDLVHNFAAEQYGYPLSLNTSDDNLNARLKQALFVSSASGTLQAPATLTFTYADGPLKVTKTFSFDPTYVVHADISVTENGAAVRAALSWPGGFGDQENAAAYTNAQVETQVAGKDEYLPVKKVSGNAVLGGPFDWAGVSDNYFAAIFMPDQPETASLTTFHNQMEIEKVRPKNGAAPAKPVKGGVPVLGAGLASTTGRMAARVYVGPKAVDVLKNTQTAAGKTLEPVLNFGFFGVIGKWLFLAIRFFNAHVTANWGWDIILMTAIINFLILPLRFQSMKSALKMQRIQPQVNAIKARYKNPKATDPKSAEMNAEVMKLYKDNNVNMFGGCLPSLIPLPLFYAFFGMLPNVVELRNAHWLWLKDLSQPDPLYILPILTVLTMFLTSFFTPSPGVDPQQQKMMAFMMPVFFGFIVFNYGSGLALYWVTGSIISIAAQMAMNRSGLGKEMREIAAKRARRNKGNTIQGKR